jgi:hypothetical protein
MQEMRGLSFDIQTTPLNQIRHIQQCRVVVPRRPNPSLNL